MDHKSKIITDKEADESVKSLISGKCFLRQNFLIHIVLVTPKPTWQTMVAIQLPN